MKKKSNTIAKIFAVVMIAMVMLPILLTTAQVVTEYVNKEIYTPWKTENQATYEQAKANVTELLNQYQ